MDKRKIYPRIRRTSNWEGDKFPVKKEVIVQEKLDGSNVTVEFVKENDQLIMKLHSRTTQINQEKPENWKPLVDWAKAHFTEQLKLNIANTMKAGNINALRFHGEWLMMAKLPYNKTHKNSFWLFDLVAVTKEKTIFQPWETVKVWGKNFKLNVVPAIKTSTLEDVIKELPDLIIDQKTLLPDSTSAREGIVIKLLDGSMRMKFVSPKFKEGMGKPREKGVPLFQINAQLVTDNMIQKYIHKLKEEGVLDLYIDYNDGPTIGKIFKHQQNLLDDFMEEEFENFIKQVTKLVKKESGKSLNNYIKKQQILQVEGGEE